MDSGFEQLNFLEEQVALLLEKYQGMGEKNRELEESLASRQDKVQQLEEILKAKDALLADVESRIDRLLRKFSDFNSPVPDTPLLPVGESS
ncbi:MAG: cell division protein ZapB [Xanthomonadaceae bacterium]|nr:cell division protein ZapB [Xanthomonadaceae bacterium]